MTEKTQKMEKEYDELIRLKTKGELSGFCKLLVGGNELLTSGINVYRLHVKEQVLG